MLYWFAFSSRQIPNCPKKMPPELRSRPSIRHNDKNSEEAKEEIPHQCKKCNKYFLKSERGAQTKLSEEDLEKWLSMKKSDIYPDLSKIHSDLCNSCGSNSKPAPSDGLDSGGGNCLSTRSIIIIFMLGLIPLLVFAAPTAYENWKHREIPFKINLHKASELEKYFDKSLDKLEQKYPYQEEKVWYTIGAGIKFVPKNKPNRPSVFMFLYDSESAGITAKCLAKDASYLAAIFLKRDTKINPVILAGLELNEARLIEDPGRMLVDYNRTLQDNGAMVVTDLQDVPAEVAKSLHFFCDAYSPLVESAVYIFTLKVDSIPKHQRSGTARDKLMELWADKMPDGTIEALITRLTPNVIAINSDTTDC